LSFKELILGCWEKEPDNRLKIEGVIESLKAMGFEFHPSPALLQAMEITDALIHPKRLEGLSYIAPYITKHRVDEPIDHYWRRNEGQTNETNAGNPPLKLNDAINGYLNNAYAPSLLLVGEAGVGKTLSVYLLADKLISQWRAYLKPLTEGEKGEVKENSKPPYFPIFIRPAVKSWTHSSLLQSILWSLQRYS